MYSALCLLLAYQYHMLGHLHTHTDDQAMVLQIHGTTIWKVNEDFSCSNKTPYWHYIQSVSLH